MAKATIPHVVIINRNYPPRVGVTGESACAMARFLQSEHGMQISVVTMRSSYAGGGSETEPIGRVHLLASLYDGKNKPIRLAASFLESFRMVWKARRLGGSQVIVMTDPPFLSFWASVLLAKKRYWSLWAMDLFPDAFVAGKLISRRNVFYRFFDSIVYRTVPKLAITLGPLQAAYLTEKYGGRLETAIVPCGVSQPAPAKEAPEWKRNIGEKFILGYCGNLGEAHSADFLKTIVRCLDGDRFHLVLSVYGSKSKEILDFVAARAGEGVTLVEKVTRAELRYIDIHLVSLFGRWAHVCVPSKAVSAVCSRSAFLFYGSPECDNWRLLGPAGWRIEETDDSGKMKHAVEEFLSNVDRESIDGKEREAKRIAAELLAVERAGLRDVATALLANQARSRDSEAG